MREISWATTLARDRSPASSVGVTNVLWDVWGVCVGVRQSEGALAHTKKKIFGLELIGLGANLHGL